MGTMAILNLCKEVKRAEKSLTKLVRELREKWGWKNGIMDWMEEFQLKLSIARSSFFEIMLKFNAAGWNPPVSLSRSN